MALEKLGPNKWQIKVCTRVKGIDYPVRKQEVFEGTKIDAELRAAEIIKAIRGHKQSSLTVRSFSDILETYKTNKNKCSAPDLSRITKLKKDLGHIEINVFADRFEEYLTILKNTPTIRGVLPNPATINRIIEMVRAAFNLSVALGHIEKNPISKTRFQKTEIKPRRRKLTSDEEIKLLNVIKENRPHIFAYVQFSLLVPCRKNELISLPKTAFNPFTNTIYVPDSKAGIPIYKPVPECMLPYFRNIPANCPHLFYRQDKYGKFHSLGDFRKSWRYCLRIAGIQDFRVHDMRACSATKLYLNNNPERVIMDVAGWKTPMLSNYWGQKSFESAQIIKFSPEQGQNIDKTGRKAINL